MKFLSLILLFSVNAQAQSNLYLFGGGERPVAAMKKFAGDAQQGLVLVIAWASSTPEAVFESIEKELGASGVSVVSSLRPPETEDEWKKLLMELRYANGVFFAGGDQTRLVRAIDQMDAHEFREALIHKYHSGTPMAGTSAGAAAMADIMITGTTTSPRFGLGFLPRVIVDTHFMARDREERLIRTLEIDVKMSGLGIDEGGVVQYKKNHLKNIGEKPAIWFTNGLAGQRERMVIEHNDSVDVRHCDELLL